MSNGDTDRDEEEGKVIRVENKIKHKVTLGGKITGSGFDDQLLREAEQRIEGLQNVFLEAADEDMERLMTAFRLAESEPEQRDTHLSTVQGVAHDIKGYGDNINYPLLTRFGNSLSLFLRKAEAPDDIRLEVTRVHVDAMRLVLNEEITGDGGETGEELFAALDEAVRKYLKASDY
ncbi:MAG: hypothetical protein QGF53_11665 [Alphaproteobacteria bacterium]|nr:hypothetical protein [Alphaproteobacteria bacterium]